LEKSTAGCLSKFSPFNVYHTMHLITTRRAQNVVQVTKALSDVINQPLYPNTVCQHLKKTGMKAMVK
ncbi:hypothetical protein HYDPIDRAFT_79956, partial [Hydnomerulius pinastri MD-312]